MASKGIIYSNPNLLINADGTDPENQRVITGATDLKGDVYGYDRWRSSYNGTALYATEQFSAGSGGLRYTASGAGTQMIIRQLLEQYLELGGKTLTLSAKVKSNTSNARLLLYDGITLNYSDYHTGGGGYEVLSITATFANTPTSDTAVYLRIDNSVADTDYIEFEWIKLEVGSVATPFVADLPGVNLAKCQRYGWAPDSDALTGQVLASGVFAVINCATPVTMRQAPSLSIIAGPYTNWMSIPGVASITPTSISIDATNCEDKVALACAIPAQTRSDMIFMSGFTKGDIFFDAEL